MSTKLPNQAELDFCYMQKALALAKQGEFTAHPNPRVGCVFTQDNKIIAKGWHEKTGAPHAEINALQQAQAQTLKGATCYVTLEPCAHHGRTSPCVEALIRVGIKRVVIATKDPNPLVSGKGIQVLREANIAVEIGLLKEEAEKLNRGFFSRMQRKRPFVRSKIAMSLDGRIAMKSGESQWITCEASRLQGHLLRASHGAILTGRGTVTKDDCRLTVRHSKINSLIITFEQPLRVVVDAHLQVTPLASIFQQPGKTLMIISDQCSNHTRQAWQNKLPEAAINKVEWIALPEKQGHVDLAALLTVLSEKEINDILIEAGPTLNGAMLQQNLIDELLIFIAPKLLGSDAISMAHIPGFINLNEHLRGKFSRFERSGSDLYLSIELADSEDVVHAY